MSELLLVRHGQAAFGTDDYDRLTELGHRQSRWLGEYFTERGLGFDRVITGTLRRHRETLDGIAERLLGLPAAQALAGLDEYQAEVLVDAWLRARGEQRPDHGGDRRAHFRMLREVLYAWVDGTLVSDAHLTFDRFAARARAALEAACAGRPQRVLIVTSGGPISTLLVHALSAAPRTMVELNLQTRNSGITELRAARERVSCVGFNAVPHLDRADRREAITHS